MTRYLEIKAGSISETIKRLSDDYQAYFKKELEKTGKGIAQMTDAEKKAFFNRVDKEFNAKNEATNGQKKPEDSNTTMVVKPGAPAGQEKVIRIPKEKLADYKSKGYVEAESFVPEQANNPYAIGMAAAMKSTGDTPPLKKSTITKAHKIADKVKEEELTDAQKKLPPALQKAIEKKEKNEEVEITEGQFKELDTRKGDLKIAKDKKQALKDKYNAIMAGQASGDENSIADQIQKLDMSIKKQEQELIDIMKKQKETKKEEVETVEEAAGADQLTNLNDKITKLQVNLSKLDKSKPESKTKEAIMKADLVTAKLRLQDVIQKRNAETKKESVNEAKKNYKSMKKSVKKEQDKEVNSKRTLTDKPITKVDVDPRIEN